MSTQNPVHNIHSIIDYSQKVEITQCPTDGQINKNVVYPYNRLLSGNEKEVLILQHPMCLFYYLLHICCNAKQSWIVWDSQSCLPLIPGVMR